MTEVKAPVAWRGRRSLRSGGLYFFENSPTSEYYGVVDALALHADYVAEKERAEKAETELAALRKAAQAVIEKWESGDDLSGFVWEIDDLRAALAQGEKP